MKTLGKVLGILLLIIVVVFVYAWIQEQPNPDLVYTQEYVVGQGNIKGHVDKERWLARGEAFAIGANDDGYAVFKDPKKAMDVICKEYKIGIKAMHKNGAPLWFRLNYKDYNGYSDGVQGAEELRQAAIVEEFIDIYENCFEKCFEE